MKKAVTLLMAITMAGSMAAVSQADITAAASTSPVTAGISRTASEDIEYNINGYDVGYTNSSRGSIYSTSSTGSSYSTKETTNKKGMFGGIFDKIKSAGKTIVNVGKEYAPEIIHEGLKYYNDTEYEKEVAQIDNSDSGLFTKGLRKLIAKGKHTLAGLGADELYSSYNETTGRTSRW
ncbi:MAG: hypothetical protein IJ571_06675 [Ruminococcus sp.]|nr:hypothetical protein [Ruminococcus sp.]